MQDKLENSIVDGCRETFKIAPLEEIVENPYPQVNACVSTQEEHREEIKRLEKNDDCSHLLKKIKQLIRKGLVDMERYVGNENTALVLQSCITGALIDSCINWIVDEYPIEKEAFVKVLCDFLPGGIIYLKR